MKARITSVKFQEYEIKQGARKGQKFTKVRIEADVVTDEQKGIVHTYHADLGLDYAKRYFQYCGYSSQSAVGQTVDVVLQKRAYVGKDGQQHTTTEIRWLNFIDDAGNPIIMPKEGESVTPF